MYKDTNNTRNADENQIKIFNSVNERIAKAAVDIETSAIEPRDVLFQHSAFCSTSLPRRNPGDKTIIEKKQGRLSVAIQATQVYNPDYERLLDEAFSKTKIYDIETTNKLENLGLTTARQIYELKRNGLAQKCAGSFSLTEIGNIYNILENKVKAFIYLGLPYGAAARLIFAYISTEVIKGKRPTIEMGRNVTNFCKLVGISVKGTNINNLRDQLLRISACTISISFADVNYYTRSHTNIIDTIGMHYYAGSGSKKRWESVIELGDTYFESVLNHSVPLNRKALLSISNNTLAMDIYSWLAQRAHRVDPQQPQFLVWPLLYDQFGAGYKEIRKFRFTFLETLKRVKVIYPEVRVEEVKGKTGISRGLNIYNSPPPIPKTLFQVTGY